MQSGLSSAKWRLCSVHLNMCEFYAIFVKNQLFILVRVPHVRCRIQCRCQCRHCNTAYFWRKCTHIHAVCDGVADHFCNVFHLCRRDCVNFAGYIRNVQVMDRCIMHIFPHNIKNLYKKYLFIFHNGLYHKVA